MVAMNKYTKPTPAEGADARSAAIIVPTFMQNPADKAEEEINLRDMNEQDVKSLQTRGELLR